MALFKRNKKEETNEKDKNNKNEDQNTVKSETNGKVKDSSKKSKYASLTDEERYELGHFQLRMIIELLGKPKDIMEKTMERVVDKLAAEPAVELISKEIAPVKEQGEQGKLWSTFSECEMWVNSFQAVASLLFEYLPSSVEILAPTKFVVRSQDLTDYFNDLQARLHETDMVAKSLRTEVDILKRQAGGMLNNLIVISLSQSPKTLKELSVAIGMETKELDKYVKRFIEHKRIKKEGEILHLTKRK